MGKSVTRLIAGLAVTGAALSGAPAAAADPEPAPADPVNPVVDAPPPVDPGVQSLGPLGALTGGDGGTHDQLVLGQRMPGPGDPAVPNTDLLSAGQFLNPTRYRVPGSDAENQYQLPSGVPGPFARVDGLKGLHAMLHGAMGRMPAPQLSEPLPGTAPPPGTNIPVGPVGNLADPGAADVPVYGTVRPPDAQAPRLPEAAPPVDVPPVP